MMTEDHARNKKWHIVIGGEKMGPFSIKQIQELSSQGKVTFVSTVWQKGMMGWVPICLVPELSAAVADAIEVDAAIPSPLKNANTVISPQLPPRSAAHEDYETDIANFFTFKGMITPIVIQVLFVLGSIGIVFYGFYVMLLEAQNIWNLFFGFMIAILGVPVMRVLCESGVVLFRINSTLTEIKEAIEKLASK
ncbi:MAG: DUF4339 domain-containing protein [Candidatus Hydrogenedens sp.]|nr:DUF4339 domain-containing protein [Candidatus Hydrogenedens sp.]